MISPRISEIGQGRGRPCSKSKLCDGCSDDLGGDGDDPSRCTLADYPDGCFPLRINYSVRQQFARWRILSGTRTAAATAYVARSVDCADGTMNSWSPPTLPAPDDVRQSDVGGRGSLYDSTAKANMTNALLKRRFAAFRAIGGSFFAVVAG